MFLTEQYGFLCKQGMIFIAEQLLSANLLLGLRSWRDLKRRGPFLLKQTRRLFYILGHSKGYLGLALRHSRNLHQFSEEQLFVVCL
jgi:hypothetical protein